MILGYIFSAAGFAAIANFLFRKNQDKGGSSRAFLSMYFLFSLFLSFAFSSQIFHLPFSPIMAGIGAFAGLLSYLMLSLTAKALQTGPPGLTFTFQNASCIFPGLLLASIFGNAFGFAITPWLLVGFALIFFGLFISAKSMEKEGGGANGKAVGASVSFAKWVVCALGMMATQGFILSIFQWRVLLLNCNDNTHWLIPWTCAQSEDVWFMPPFFAVPALLQLFFFWKVERRKFSVSETLYGASSGILNCACTVLLLLATKSLGIVKKEMLFPLFTISVILFCNLWGWKIYKERVNWWGIALCLLGVLVGLL
jgi:drug/metabolite transporter (DMT)-like permease